MSATRLYLIRHGEVESRYHEVFGGRIDMELSDRGLEQASLVADYFRRRPLQALYTSPMKRARRTLHPVAQTSQIQPVTLEGLREVDFGDWTGLKWREVQARFGVNPFAWLELLDQSAIPNAECPKAWRHRVDLCLSRISERDQGRSVGVVCHGGVIRMILSILLGLPLPSLAAFEIEYGGITSLHWRPDRTRLHFLNFVPWREVL